jgi:ATP-dependent exoDNAse (exonuclease V) beta subunit
VAVLKEEKILKDLNPEQREAALYLEGPLLILAGAGSGKTRVLTYRVALLTARGVEPSISWLSPSPTKRRRR